MNRQAARLIGIAAVGMTLGAMGIYAGLLDALPPAHRPPETGGTFLIPALVIFALVGATILWHRPTHPIGWVYTATGLLLALSGPLTLYAIIVTPLGERLPGAGISGRASGVAFISGFFLPITYGLLLFPDGRLPSPRWRPVALAIPVVLLAVFLGDTGQTNIGAVRTVGSVATVSVAAASIASFFRRFQRSGGTERQQLKWAMAAMGLLVAGIFPALLSPLLGITEAWLALPLFLGLTLYPLSVGIAILRYRLYDIDLLIKRTLVYGATTVALAVTFWIGILALQRLLSPVTSGSEVTIAASTLVSLALFQPIRMRVQDRVDRRFDRSRYDAAHVLDGFADRLRDEVDLEEVRSDLMWAVHDSMQPAHASLWVRGERS